MAGSTRTSRPASGAAAWPADRRPAYEGGGEGAPPDPTEFVFDFTVGSMPEGATLGRASTGTYFNSSGVLSLASIDVARFDHSFSGSGWQLVGLLVEPQRTNFVSNSEAIGNWSLDVVSANANTTVAPDGNATADTITASAANNVHRARRSSLAAITAGVTGSVSVFAKPGTLANFALGSYDGGAKLLWADLSTGAVTPDGGSPFSHSMAVNVSGGWFRYGGVWTGNGSVTEVNLWQGKPDGTQSLGWNAVGSETSIFWGAQLEIADSGPTITSYIPTGAGTSTRSADVLTLDLDDGVYNVEVVTANGVFTSSISVAGGSGYEFDWSDHAGASGERHVRTITATLT